jgi:adenosylcobinamide-phosphate synthase
MISARAEPLLLALICEAAIGYPTALFAVVGHPVTWIGTAIAALDQDWNRGSPTRRRMTGIAVVTLLVAGAAATGWIITALAGDGWGWITIALVATTGLAQRSLDDHVRAVARPLRLGDLGAARVAVARIVGRDTGALDETGIAVAATESLAESFCDGVVAPAFWFLIAGLPGLFACKAINTADSMIGHRDDRYRWFGWAAARADDVVHWVPARLSGMLIAMAGGGGLSVMWRDARHHASPNGGWPEAAMARALARRLGGPVSYGGEPAMRAWLGDGPLPTATDLDRALGIYRWACLLLWLLVGGVAWLQ